MHIETIDIGKHSGFDSKIISFDLYIDQYRKYKRKHVETIDILYIPDLILLLYFPIRVISLATSKMAPGQLSKKAMERNNEFELIFLIICRYLNPVKADGNFIENSQVATTL